MAAGPHQIDETRFSRFFKAERAIDKAINLAGRRRVTVSLRNMGLSREEWDAQLRPKYLEAGWAKAEWVADERDGDSVCLSNKEE